MEAVVARIAPWAGLRNAGAKPVPGNSELWGRGGNEIVEVTAAARGDERKVGVKGLIISFWNASFAAKILGLRCSLLYGLYLGFMGFPATLSLCLLLEMCCLSWTSELT